MTGKIFKITIIILISILITVMLSLVLFAIINGYSARYMISRIFPGTVENIYKPYKVVEIQTSPGASVVGDDGYVYILDDKNLSVYNDRGIEDFSEILKYEEAVMSGKDKRVLVYDRPSGDYIVFKEGEKVYDDTLGRTILGANVQENGLIMFILKGRDGFLGSALVLNDSNEIIAEYNYSDRFPVSGCSLDDSDKFAVAGIYSNNTGKTGIDIFESYNEVPIAGLNRDYLLPLAMSIGSDAFAAAGTNNVFVFSSAGAELMSHEFNEIIRMAASGNNCFIADRRTGSDRIICIGRNGSQKWSYSTGLATEGLVTGERHLFYWSGIYAACIDDKGKPVELQSGFDQVVGIADLGNGKAVVVTTGKLVFNEYH